MEDLFWVIFFVLFIVAPILEKVLKGGAGRRPPGPPLPGQRLPQSRLPGGAPVPRRVEPRLPPGPGPEPAETTARSTDQNAVDILPADLWEMLTGQRPASTGPEPTRPAPAPAPVPVPETWSEVEPADEEEAFDTRATPQPRNEDADVERLMRKRQLEQAEARTAQHVPPEIVSLESTLVPEPKRHAAFHKKLAEAPALELERTRSDAPAFRMDRLGRSELQRAVLLKEILGKPKALE